MEPMTMDDAAKLAPFVEAAKTDTAPIVDEWECRFVGCALVFEDGSDYGLLAHMPHDDGPPWHYNAFCHPVMVGEFVEGPTNV